MVRVESELSNWIWWEGKCQTLPYFSYPIYCVCLSLAMKGNKSDGLAHLCSCLEHQRNSE